MKMPLQPDLEVNGEVISVAADRRRGAEPPRAAGQARLRLAGGGAGAGGAGPASAGGRAARPRTLRRDELAPGSRETDDEALIRAVIEHHVRPAPPDEAACRAFYAANPGRFRAPSLYEAVAHPAARRARRRRRPRRRPRRSPRPSSPSIAPRPRRLRPARPRKFRLRLARQRRPPRPDRRRGHRARVRGGAGDPAGGRHDARSRSRPATASTSSASTPAPRARSCPSRRCIRGFSDMLERAAWARERAGAGGPPAETARVTRRRLSRRPRARRITTHPPSASTSCLVAS